MVDKNVTVSVKTMEPPPSRNGRGVSSDTHLGLDDTELAIIEEVRRFRQDVMPARAIKHDRAATFPSDNFADLHRMGLLGLAIPKEYGGRGFYIANRLLVEIMVVEELAKACSSTGQGFHNHVFPLEMIRMLGTEEQRRFFFTDVLDHGAVFGGWASEGPGRKTAFELKTKVRKVDGGYLLNGEKFFSTNSGGATWGQVWGHLEGEEPSADNLFLAMVRMDQEGVEQLHDWDPLGQRATTSGTTRYTNVFVPDLQMLGGSGAYYSNPLIGAFFQIGWAAVYAGIAGGALEKTVELAVNHARPWGETDLERAIDDPYVQNDVADMSIAVEATRLLLYRAATLLEAASHDFSHRPEAQTAVYRAKVMASETALDVSSRLFQVAGARAAAAAPKTGIDAFWRNARTFTLHDPVNYRRQRIGRYVLGVEDPPIGWY